MTTTTPPSSFTGTIPIDDTSLWVSDPGGPSRPVLFLNGAYADTSHWKKTIALLDPAEHRCVTFDGRARGRSGTSSDTSFAAAMRDVVTVREARQLRAPILVGWSYGAQLAVHVADQHPEWVAGVVCVDGALPFGLTDPAGHEHVRRLFRRVGWLLPLGARVGLAARMSATQHAEINIESNEIGARIAPVLERLTCPVRFVLGTGGHLGASAEIMAEVRATLDPVLAVNPNVAVTVQVPSGHSKIPSRHADAIVRAIREVEAAAATLGS